MAAAANNKNLPLFDVKTAYENWKNEIKFGDASQNWTKRNKPWQLPCH